MAEPTLLDKAKANVVKGSIDEAIQQLGEVLNGEFFEPEALFMLGACLHGKGLHGLSAVITSAAIDARAAQGKKFPEALMNLGAAYKAEHKNETAQRIWEDALSCERLPRERSKILTNIAGLYVNEGQPERAIRFCDLALDEDPKNYGAMANRGMACLEMGRWREGWEGFRATYESGDRVRRHYPDVPVWDGSTDKIVIVWGDQGIGDEIFFASSLRDLIGISRKVILDCHPRLPALFRRSFPDIEVHGTRKNLTELPWLHDCPAEAAVGLADLHGVFRNEANCWSGKPFLKAREWELQKPRGDRPLRIGLSWTGGSKKTRQELRSVPLAALLPVMQAQPEAEWFSLQYTPNAAREVCELEEQTGFRVSHFPGFVECFDYDRTASFVSSLDLVVTVCTTVHHLGGALGVPTWTLVPKRCSWRYGGGKDTLPWYDSVRLFRQERADDWSGPIERIASEIANF